MRSKLSAILLMFVALPALAQQPAEQQRSRRPAPAPQPSTPTPQSTEPEPPARARQMEAEQLYESLITATAADNTVSKDRGEEMKDRWLRQFSQAFGTDTPDPDAPGSLVRPAAGELTVVLDDAAAAELGSRR